MPWASIQKISTRAKGARVSVSTKVETAASERTCFFSARNSKAAADHQGDPGDLPVADDSDYQSREGHRHRQPLELCQPLPEQDVPNRIARMGFI